MTVAHQGALHDAFATFSVAVFSHFGHDSCSYREEIGYQDGTLDSDRLNSHSRRWNSIGQSETSIDRRAFDLDTIKKAWSKLPDVSLGNLNINKSGTG